MKIVSKLTKSHRLTHAIARCYRAAGYRPRLIRSPDGRSQIGIRGRLVRKYTPCGMCCSHGGGVPQLVQVAPLYHFVLNGQFPG